MSRFTRREWLATAPLLLTPTAFGQTTTKTILLGFSLYGMKSLPLADAIRACAAIGYDGVELALMPGYPSEPKQLSADARKELRKQLQDAKLGLHGLMENLAEPAADAVHRANLDRLKAAAELGHALSPGAPPVIETILGGKPADWEKVKDKLVERLQAWAAVAKDAKTVIAIKPHVGNALHTVEGTLWLLKQIDSPWLRLGFDFSHLKLEGVTLADAITSLVPHAAFIHLKDAKGTPAKFEFLLPGEGGIDYGDYARRLTAAKYAGPVVVEVSGQISNKPGYDPVAAAKASYANLAKAFGR
ncbi:sugar phosphate isomerase/epimerase family protein [Limnoglobus roseus]|uniref:Sugar phosphate isomerase/epimerase n=1 Tax=Limnoglobus roseus TaxID=2598579 RepID=A0A5C1A7H8_9BACT|nr:sugar phosphate isomerase/epimerase [Limnoglobus roseus]QEL14425.1 sugar phosphate isomerase/epimerase [Limnoglobus roseus]